MNLKHEQSIILFQLFIYMLDHWPFSFFSQKALVTLLVDLVSDLVSWPTEPIFKNNVNSNLLKRFMGLRSAKFVHRTGTRTR